MVLCEEFELSRVSGNPSIIGMISALVSDTLPVRIDPLVAAFRLVGNADEHATLSLVVQDETGALSKGTSVAEIAQRRSLRNAHFSRTDRDHVVREVFRRAAP